MSEEEPKAADRERDAANEELRRLHPVEAQAGGLGILFFAAAAALFVFLLVVALLAVVLMR